MDMIDVASKALTDTGRIIKELNYEFSGNDSVRKLWDTVNPEATGVDVTAILGAEYDIHAAGTTESANRSIKKQRAQEMYAALQASPFMQVDPTGKRIYQLTKDLIVEGFGQRSAEPYIGTEQEAAQIPMAQQAAQVMAFAEQMKGAMEQANAGGAPGEGGGGETPGMGVLGGMGV